MTNVRRVTRTLLHVLSTTNPRPYPLQGCFMVHPLGSSPLWRRTLWVACCILMLAGCQGEIPRSSVTGHLTIDRRPTPQGVRVVFTRQGADPRPCIGVTNDQGMFVMYDKPGMRGLLAGRYNVSIALSDDEDTGNVMLPPALAGITIPKAYRTGSSTLACDVPRSGTVFDIDITTK